MTCSICGKGTGPGAMLCRPCKAALKRARQFTVQVLPGTPIAVTRPGDAFPVMTLPQRTPRAEPADERRRRLALAALAVALFAAAAYVGGRGLATARAERQAPALTTLAPREPLPPPHFAATAPDVLPPASRTVATPAPARRAAANPAPLHDAAAVPAMSPAAPATTLAQAQEPVRAATTAAAPAPDRWQTVSDALARCAEEGGLSGFICDQRVRLDACDGYWGRVAQCPAPSLPANPR
ncbi:MAG: hypothetical protein U1F48_07055 [Burkholderiales bacterium]